MVGRCFRLINTHKSLSKHATTDIGMIRTGGTRHCNIELFSFLSSIPPFPALSPHIEYELKGQGHCHGERCKQSSQLKADNFHYASFGLHQWALDCKETWSKLDHQLSDDYDGKMSDVLYTFLAALEKKKSTRRVINYVKFQLAAESILSAVQKHTENVPFFSVSHELTSWGIHGNSHYEIGTINNRNIYRYILLVI